MSAVRQPGPLRGSPSFRRLWLARTISHLGDGIALVALVLFVEASRGSGVAVGTLLLAMSVPRFLGPLAGSVADMTEQRTLMVACDLGRAAIFVALAVFAVPFPALIALVAASSVLDTLFEPAGRSSVPALVDAESLLRANAWMGTSLNLQVALGPVLGGALVATLGVRGALAANSLSFILSAAMLIGLPHLRTPPGDSRRGLFSAGAEGLMFAWRAPAIRAVVVALFLGVAFAAIDNVALVFLVRRTLGGGAIAFGLVSGAYGMGMMAGSIGLSWRGSALAYGTLFLLGWFASGAGTVLTGVAPLLLIAAVAQAFAGIGNGVANIAGDTLIQRLVPRPMLGRVFGLVSTASFGGSTLAYAVGGFALDLTSPRTVFVIGGGGVLAVALFLAVALRRTLAGPGTTGAGPPKTPS